MKIQDVMKSFLEIEASLFYFLDLHEGTTDLTFFLFSVGILVV